MREARERGKKRVCDGDAVRAAPSRGLHAFHGLAKPAPERNRHDDVFWFSASDQVNDFSAGRRGKGGHSQKYKMVFEVFGENRSEVAANDHDPPSLIKA